MDPATMVLVLGFLGGLVFAGVAILVHRKSSRPSLDVPYRPDPISIDMINMASIKVAGVGGLGLVAMAAAVALGVPRIAQSMALGIALGAIGAAIVIFRRSRTGAMPSSGRGLGANTTLKIDMPPDEPSPAERSANGLDCSLAPVPR
jgi:hypothetical protein